MTLQMIFGKLNAQMFSPVAPKLLLLLNFASVRKLFWAPSNRRKTCLEIEESTGKTSPPPPPYLSTSVSFYFSWQKATPGPRLSKNTFCFPVEVQNVGGQRLTMKICTLSVAVLFYKLMHVENICPNKLCSIISSRIHWLSLSRVQITQVTTAKIP